MTSRAQPELSANVGTYADFLRDMLNRIRIQGVATEGDITYPLASLSLEEDSNLAIALVKSWAVVCDILSFYSDRLLNEGYLATARQPESILKLVDMMGYEPARNVVAEVHLNFTVATRPGVNAGLKVPKGTPVASVPGPGENPQVFEVSEEADVAGDWNAAQVFLAPPEAGPAKAEIQTDQSGMLYLDVETTRPSPGVGDYMAFLPASATSGLALAPECLAQLAKVASPEPRRTRLCWMPQSRDDTKLIGNDFQLVALHQMAKLFGQNAPPWSSLPNAIKLQNGATLSGGVIVLRSGDSLAASRGLPLVKPGEFPVRALLPAGNLMLAATSVGVFTTQATGGWTPVRSGPIPTDIYSLAAAANGDLFAGSVGAVFRSTDGGNTWDPLNGVVSVQLVPGKSGKPDTWVPVSSQLPRVVVRCLAADFVKSVVYAGTDNGVFSSSFSGGGWARWEAGYKTKPWTDGPIYALALAPNGETLLAGTEKGIATVHTGGGQNFHAETSPHSIRDILYVEEAPNISWICAADGGIFLKSHGPSWVAFNNGLPGANSKSGLTPLTVWKLAAGRSSAGAVYAATSLGTYCLDAKTERWELVGALPIVFQFAAVPGVSSALDQSLLPPEVISAFAQNKSELKLQAAVVVEKAGASWFVFAAPSGGSAWRIELQKETMVVSSADTRAATVDEEGGVWSVLPSAGIVEKDWPGLSASAAQLDLDDLYPAIQPPGWIVLRDASGTDATNHSVLVAAPVLKVSTVERSSFWLHGMVSRIDSGESSRDLIDGLSVRSTQVLAQSEILTRATRKVTQLSAAMGPCTLLLASPWKSAPASGSTVSLTGICRAAPGADISGPFIPDTLPLLCKLSSTATATGASGITSVTIDLPEQITFSPTAGAKLHANVVHATQGETIRELLGSGDASRRHQRFTLKKAPLAFVAGKDGSPVSTLQVDVDGLRWEEVSDFDMADPKDMIYMVKLNKNGRAAVIFGDGVNGARLPTGMDNVRAAYRVADPKGHKVALGNLSNLRSHPLGIRSVENHTEAPKSGLEQPSDMRTQAVRAASTPDRLISARDYESFVKLTFGLSAKVRVLPGNRGIMLNIASPGWGDAAKAVDPFEIQRKVRAAQALNWPLQVNLASPESVPRQS
jgi:hypothetical protein